MGKIGSRGRANRSRISSRRLTDPVGRGSFLRRRHGILINHVLVTAWRGLREGQGLATQGQLPMNEPGVRKRSLYATNQGSGHGHVANTCEKNTFESQHRP